jgi:hypothetical protein
MQLAVRRLKEQEQLLSEQKTKLDEMGLKPDEVKRAMDPLRSFRQQLAEETETGNVRKDKPQTCVSDEQSGFGDQAGAKG